MENCYWRTQKPNKVISYKSIEKNVEKSISEIIFLLKITQNSFDVSPIVNPKSTDRFFWTFVMAEVEVCTGLLKSFSSKMHNAIAIYKKIISQ
jgi:hypothetical protein